MANEKPTLWDRRLYSEEDYSPLLDLSERDGLKRYDSGQLKKSAEFYAQEVKAANDEQNKAAGAANLIRRELAARHREDVAANYRLSNDHLKLISAMQFEGMWHGDVVSIGVDGKRPFGSSNDLTSNVAEILGWYDDDDDYEPSDEVCDRVARILDELPLAVNEVMRRGVASATSEIAESANRKSQ